MLTGASLNGARECLMYRAACAAPSDTDFGNGPQGCYSTSLLHGSYVAQLIYIRNGVGIHDSVQSIQRLLESCDLSNLIGHRLVISCPNSSQGAPCRNTAPRLIL